MEIRSAKFIKGVVAPNEILEEDKLQIAFIGRSNVGKSSVINSLTKQKDLAKTSSFPGRTQQINIFLINKNYYFIDLPGYGFAMLSGKERKQLALLINWYLFESEYEQEKVVFIIDAHTGLTEQDLDMLRCLEDGQKDIVVVANKTDKIKKSDYDRQMKKIQEAVGGHKVIPYSSEKRTGVKELLNEILRG